MDQEKVGCFLKKLRLEKGLTQEQLAEKFNISNRTVSRWETGRNMPDLSLLAELARFYGVGTDEIIDGERKPIVTKEESRSKENEVAVKMADYANRQQSILLIWVRRISLLGILLMTVILAIQTFTYEPGIASFMCYVLSVLAFVSMTILGLHANGILERLAMNRKFVVGCKVLVIGAVAVVGSFVMRMLLVLGLVVLAESSPAQTMSGIESYDKSYYLKNYGGDLDSGWFVFPDSTEGMIEPEFVSSLKTGLFDTDGYVILSTRYDEEWYYAEVERLSAIECTLSFGEETVTQHVKYDKDSYVLPAYVAVDGFDSVYEYALLDEEAHTIHYILLSYPSALKLGEYKKYLKKDIAEYDIENVLSKFSIYAHSFDGGQSWIEYSDGQTIE